MMGLTEQTKFLGSTGWQQRSNFKMTGETLEVRSDKTKPREETEVKLKKQEKEKMSLKEPLKEI